MHSTQTNTKRRTTKMMKLSWFLIYLLRLSVWCLQDNRSIANRLPSGNSVNGMLPSASNENEVVWRSNISLPQLSKGQRALMDYIVNVSCFSHSDYRHVHIFVDQTLRTSISDEIIRQSSACLTAGMFTTA